MRPVRSALFLPCAHRAAFPDDAGAQRRLLARCGFPELPLLAAFCCGQPAATAGDRDGATGMVASWREAASRFDTVLVASATCAGHLAAHGVGAPLVRYAPDVLIDTIRETSKAPRVPIYLHRPCHDVWDEARWGEFERWLAATANVEILARPFRDPCCGFGGVFSTLFDRTAGAMMEHRLAAIGAVGARAIVSAEPGCLSHFAAHANGGVPVVPLASYLVERGIG
jgi:L-lactate dehydrogenase complex protein LldE